MFEKLSVWIFKKTPRKYREYFFKNSFINVAKKEYEKMEKLDNFKADKGYINLAKMMKENVYPRLFEAMDRHGNDHVIINTTNIKDFKIDKDGLVNMRGSGDNNWEQLGNAREDDWEPIIRMCNNPKNILYYSKICESIMDKLDELTENDNKNRELLERAKRFGTVYDRKVLIEKVELEFDEK